jgi:hypothetical protein
MIQTQSQNNEIRQIRGKAMSESMSEVRYKVSDMVWCEVCRKVWSKVSNKVWVKVWRKLFR